MGDTNVKRPPKVSKDLQNAIYDDFVKKAQNDAKVSGIIYLEAFRANRPRLSPDILGLRSRPIYLDVLRSFEPWHNMRTTNHSRTWLQLRTCDP